MIEGQHDEAAWRAVIGHTNQAYYLEQFGNGGGNVRRWHWPAFFFTWYWLLYRKMWGWAVGYFFLPYIVFALLGIVAAVLMPHGGEGLIGAMYLAYIAAIFLGPPLMANKLYHAHCSKLVRQAGAGATSAEHALARLESRGGTSNIALILVGIFGGIALIGILAAVALPAYQDYTQRAKVMQAYSVAQAVARQVGQTYEANGTLPQSLDGMAGANSLPQGQALKIDPSNGVITLELQLSKYLGGSLQLVPELDQNKHVVWQCHTENLQRVAPKECRQ